jgi:hypothetical protein
VDDLCLISKYSLQLLNPKFITYINDWQLGDMSPEGLLFIPAIDSPINKDLLVVTNEVSNNTVIYAVAVTVPESVATWGLLGLGLLGILTSKPN